MFKKLIAKDFQSHKVTEIELVPGVNVFTAVRENPNNVGKSALASKSLLLLAKNRPRGGKYFSDFAGKEGCVEVGAETIEGDSVSLKKYVKVKVDKKTGKKKKELHAGLESKDGEKVSAIYTINGREYTGFGADVPDEVVKALNLSDLNIQKQLSPHFLVTSSPGEIARVINKVTRLEEYIEWNSELTKRINKRNGKISLLEDDIEKKKNKLELFSDIDEVESLVIELQKTEQKLEEVDLSHEILTKLLDQVEEITEEIEALNGFLSAEKYVLRAEKLDKELKNLLLEKSLLSEVAVTNEIVKKLTPYLEELIVLHDDFEKVDNELKKISVEKVLLEETIGVKEEIDKLQSYLNDLVNLYNPLEEVNNEFVSVSKFKEIATEFVEIEQSRNDLEKEKEVLVQEYSSLLKELGKCPTCFSDIDNKMIERVVKEL